MKRFKQRLSWLLIMTMIASQSVFLSAADTADEDEYYEEDTVLLNDLSMGNSPMRSKIMKAAKWNPLASPSVTVSEKPESISGAKYTVYYANGNDITILASDSNTYIVEDKTGAVTEVDGGATYVFAGAT